MKLFINTKIKIRKRLSKLEVANLKINSIWFNSKHIQVQKCSLPEEFMQELIDSITAVSKMEPTVEWKHGSMVVWRLINDN